MSEPKHTPGPWGCERMTGDCYLIFDIAEGQGIARTFEPEEVYWDTPPTDEEREFHARLLAAAPALLEFVGDFLGWTEQRGNYKTRSQLKADAKALFCEVKK